MIYLSFDPDKIFWEAGYTLLLLDNRLDEEILKYYTLLPKTVSNKLKLWVSENNNSTKEDFINKIYENFE